MRGIDETAREAEEAAEKRDMKSLADERTLLRSPEHAGTSEPAEYNRQAVTNHPKRSNHHGRAQKILGIPEEWEGSWV